MNRTNPNPKELKRAVIHCGRCGGKGIYFDPQVEIGHSGDLKLCSCITNRCQCGGYPPYRYWDEESKSRECICRSARRRLLRTKRLFKESHIPGRFRWKFQDDFLHSAPDGTSVPLADKVLPLVSSLVDRGAEPQVGFFLFGPPGTGKTLAGCIMLNELILHWGKAGRFLNLSLMYFQKLRATYSEESAHYGQTWQIIEELCNIPFLVVDDFGIQRNTEWEEEMLYGLLDSRYADGRFTVITTNQSVDEVQQLSRGRIYSRISEMCHQVEMAGMDYRQHLQSRKYGI